MEYISIILLLDKLLNNRDIIRYIKELKVIQERNDKREKQFNKTKDFFIENNFYNWLLHDIDLRYKINKSNTSQMSLYDIQLVKYYNKYFKALGICNYRRTLGLNKCFQLQWWKTTEKNHLEWRRIHDVIKSDICIMRLKEGNYDMENGIDYYHSNELLIKVEGIKRLTYIEYILINYYFPYDIDIRILDSKTIYNDKNNIPYWVQ
ncbi:MAG: hypothetical protein CL779_00130 [Chloroflexi bacterium]|nr:hypothetical protein [Chloroflexota bacterium]